MSVAFRCCRRESELMSMLGLDDEASRRIDRAYATPDVVAQRVEVMGLLAPQPGERVLDIGSGPGYLLAEIAAAVGQTGAAHGIDPSTSMNSLARARTASWSWVRVDEGDATALPYPDGSFDAVVATQVYEYVADMPLALAEVHRGLRPGGRVLILDTDWDSLVWHTANRDLHARVLAAWAEHLVHLHLPRLLPGLLRRAGFEVTRRHTMTIFNTDLNQDTFNGNITELIAGFVTGRHGFTGQDSGAWLADLRARADEDDYLFSLNRYVFLARTIRAGQPPR